MKIFNNKAKTFLVLASFFVFGCSGIQSKQDVFDQASRAGAIELDTDDNGAIDINRGGTNATTAIDARTSLGLQSGYSDTQAEGFRLGVTAVTGK